MQGYKSNDLFDEEIKVSVKKGKFWKSDALVKASKILLSTKKFQEKK